MSRSPWAWPPEGCDRKTALAIDAQRDSSPRDALERAIKAAGGGSVLGPALGITHQAVGQWRICPPRRVLEVERITGIPRHELRPDIYPPMARPALSVPAAGEAQP